MSDVAEATAAIPVPEKSADLAVGFVFLSGDKEWLGGLNYFRSLFSAIHVLPRSHIKLVAFIGDDADQEDYGFPPSIRFVRDAAFGRRRLKWLLNKLAERLLGIPLLSNRILLRHGIRVLSHESPTRNAAIRSIGWIPDFQHFHLPQFFAPQELQRRNQHFRKLLTHCDLVVVSSESARKDLEKFAPQHVAKARVLQFCAVLPQLAAGTSVDLKTLYGLTGPYFYIPNQVWAHKNHITAVRALARLSEKYPELKIVCSGGLADYRNPGHLPALRAEIEKEALAGRFILLGVIPYQHIAQLMLRSVAVINPSLFEGWSTTVEEAKAIGVPLLLSSIDVHLEQCEHYPAAAFFAPENVDALADAMQSRLSSWAEQPAHDPRAALENHGLRVTEFALAYQRIVDELHAHSTGN